MNKQQVLNFMPHRPPFLFIDSVSEIKVPNDANITETSSSKDLVGTHVIAKFKVTKEMEILKGHFPGNPIVPGVVQIEMMAQASAFVSLGLHIDKDKYRVETLLLGSEAAKFRKPIVPEMELEIHAIMDKCRGTIAHYSCEVYCNGQKISEARILAKLDVIKKED